jgi:hypothetical protein
MVIRILLSVLLALGCVSPACWWESVEIADSAHIAWVNGAYVGLLAEYPEAGTVELPLTVRIVTDPLDESALYAEVSLYYRDGAGDWHQIGAAYSAPSPTTAFEFAESQCPFGHEIITAAHYSGGASGRIAIHISNGVSQNWDPLTMDPDEEGLNVYPTGADGHIVGFTVSATNQRPSRPIRGVHP